MLTVEQMQKLEMAGFACNRDDGTCKAIKLGSEYTIYGAVRNGGFLLTRSGYGLLDPEYVVVSLEALKREYTPKFKATKKEITYKSHVVQDIQVATPWMQAPKRTALMTEEDSKWFNSLPVGQKLEITIKLVD